MGVLPTGTVTFLLTDVEGSTRLWEAHPQTMRAALARHDALIEETVAGHGGVLVRPRGEGDSRFAVFARASEAIAAAVAVQQALHAETWPRETVLRVRAAVHTGEADLREGDYYGSAVNRCARLRGVAHGGQTLLSLATAHLVRDSLPPGTELHDLGQHRLKDLSRPEHIYQLTGPDLPSRFAPLTTLESRATNLPVQQTSFLGRERELAEVIALLRQPDIHLLSLTGPGGTGKTRLALQAAAEMLDTFADGVFFVDLAPLREIGPVLSTIATALCLREGGSQALKELVTNYLRDKELLLVLDNFEQVVAAAPLVSTLLAGCPRLRVVVTSRTVLHLYGEQEYPVPPLALPALHRLPPFDLLTQYEAVALFIARAKLAQADFVVTPENASAVAEICVRLDGLPLAIELATARIKLLPPRALLTRLESRLKMLTGGARDLPARHQTLRGALDWSYDLLDAAEQMLFARLSVFVGGCTLEAAETVCAAVGGQPLDVLTGLLSLVDKSLMHQDADVPWGEPRFRMLETIREYAAERLAARGETEGARHAHAAQFLALAEEAEPHVSGAQQEEWLGRLAAEHDNLRAVLHWAREQEAHRELGLRLAGALWRFWDVRGHLGEGRSWLEGFCAPVRSGTGPTSAAALAVRAKALTGAGILAFAQGDTARATILHAESLALFRALGDKGGIADSLHNLGNVVCEQGDYARAMVLYEESLALKRELGDKRNIAYSLTNLGNVAYQQGDTARATILHAESLALFRALGDKGGIADSLHNLGNVVCEQGDYARAMVLYEESLALRRGLEDRQGIAYSLRHLGIVAHHQGDNARATVLCGESLILFRELGDKRGIGVALEGLAHAATGPDTASAVRQSAGQLLGAAATLRVAIGTPLPPREQADYERTVATLRASLGEAAWAVAWNTGQALPLEQAIALALPRNPFAATPGDPTRCATSAQAAEADGNPR